MREKQITRQETTLRRRTAWHAAGGKTLCLTLRPDTL